MVHRIVVRVSPSKSTAKSSADGLLGFMTVFKVAMIAFFVIAVAKMQHTEYGFMQILLWSSDATPQMEQDGVFYGIQRPVLLTIVIIAILGITLNYTTTKSDKGIAIMMYAWGIQLSNVVVTDRIDGTTHYHPLNPRFIPRDVILDCIVTEVVLAHKVQSMVALRTKNYHHSPSGNSPHCPHENDGPIQLVSVLPGVHLSYRECLVVRNQIMNYLQDL
jgi:hypothetical protein